METCIYSRLIAGTMTWGSWGKQLSKSQMIDLIQHCIAENLTTFDHADIYGGYSTEAEFGKAFAESRINRENIQLISKCGIQLVDEQRKTTVKHYNYNKEYIISSAEQSLKNLKTDFLDLLLLHRPSPLMQPEEISEAITHLLNQGKIKAFGVSNFSTSQTELLASPLNITANQIEFSLTESSAMQNGSFDNMVSKDIIAMAWSPLGTVFREENEQTKRIHRLLDELTQTYSATKDQLLLAWLMKHPAKVHPVIGTTTKKRISNAAKVLDIEMDLQDWFRMWEVSMGTEAP